MSTPAPHSAKEAPMTTTGTPLAAFDLLGDAADHAHANSSARLCHADAVKALAAGNVELAARSAIRSLEHSVGILHPAWKAAVKAFPGLSAHDRA